MPLCNLAVLLYMLCCLFSNTNIQFTDMKKPGYFIMLKIKNSKKKTKIKNSNLEGYDIMIL